MTCLSVTSSCSWDAFILSWACERSQGMGAAAEPQGAIRIWGCGDVLTSSPCDGPPASWPARACTEALLPWWMHHIINAPHHPDQLLLVQGGLVWVCSWGKKWAGAAELLWAPTAAWSSPIADKTPCCPQYGLYGSASVQAVYQISSFCMMF